jgi:hypothetical protein
MSLTLALALAFCAPYSRTYLLVRTPYRISVQNWRPKPFRRSHTDEITVVSAKAWHYVHLYD